MSKHPPHTYLILMALWLMVFSSSSQVIIIAPILPRIGEALAVSETLLGLLGTSYALLLSLAMAVGQLSFGIGTALAGLTFTTYGYLSNTALAATSIVLMALLVRFFLPEPVKPVPESRPTEVAKAS